ncbi:succinate dehydrogenase cytochrome b560 subunit [Sodiomyces alkalinus F11]|uniref:Succinate dehydrogenase cytochrome b560 subunit n=1 Tax=Sodiomyces alkalinus (strain CBS 110278 / VKM F-3762 / F11) TaxID=1314773 RepID=A0A3N2PX57_SODAK|nr:succinate dehydrogenase cytochrome b560 subunit [Sodiomyces alkalinus F11]ROT39054.1 succinate dehydrogenase cytochrome b560 subunit [Sodiomyces alkalinus F11]
MIAQRVGVSAARRIVAGNPSGFFTQHLPKLAASRLSTTQIRPVGTSKITAEDAHSLLAQQRLNRPVAPHLTAYRYDQTWFGASIWNRFTGGALSGAFYAYFAVYLVSPLLGWHVESASLAASFAALPAVAKGGIKFLVAWPFAFHCVNGVRHLSYDLAFGFAKKQIVKWGWAVWGTSLVLGLYAGFAL